MKIASLKHAGLSKSFTFKNRSSKKDKGESGGALPPLVQNALVYLNKHDGIRTEGIFRITGVISEIERIAKEYEKGKEVPLEHVVDIHTIAGLLKHYLRTRPGGLIPTRMHGCFLAAGAMQDEDVRLLCLARALKSMPTVSMLIVMKICEYLYEVQKHEEVNKMSINNLAIVFGSTFLPVAIDNLEKAVVQTTHANACIETLIRFYKRVMVHVEVEHKEEESTSTEVSVFTELLHQHVSVVDKHSRRRKSKDNSEPDLRQRANTILSSDAAVVTTPPSPVSSSSTHSHAHAGSDENKRSSVRNIFRKKSNAGLENEVQVVHDNVFASVVLAENICGRAELEALVHHLMVGDAETYYKQLQNISKSTVGVREKLQLAALHTCRDNRKANDKGRLVA